MVDIVVVAVIVVVVVVVVVVIVVVVVVVVVVVAVVAVAAAVVVAFVVVAAFIAVDLWQKLPLACQNILRCSSAMPNLKRQQTELSNIFKHLRRLQYVHVCIYLIYLHFVRIHFL